MPILSDRKDISENKLILRSLTFFNELEQRYNRNEILYDIPNEKLEIYQEKKPIPKMKAKEII